MNEADLAKMIVNISAAIAPVQQLVLGFAYLLGLLFFLHGMHKLYRIADRRSTSSSGQKMFVPLMNIMVGVALIALPSTIDVMARTAFGYESVLQYSPSATIDTVQAMTYLIQLAGLIWFIRGCVLLVQASEPGVQHGPKGLAFLVAGVLAMNHTATVDTLSTLLLQLSDLSVKFKDMVGY